MRPRNILIVNELGSDNLGDIAISRCAVDLFNKHGFNVKPHGFAENDWSDLNKGRFSKLIELTWNIKILRYVLWYVRNIKRIRAALDSEFKPALIIGGGQLILSRATFPVAMYFWIKEAEKRSIPVIVAGVGCGSKFDPIDTLLYKHAFKYVKKIYARERVSISKIKKIFLAKADFMPDFVFSLYPKPQNRPRLNILVSPVEYGVYVKCNNERNRTRCMSFKEYVSFWNSISLWYLEKLEPGGKLIFAGTTVKDNEFISEMTRCKEMMECLSKGLVSTINPSKVESYLDVIDKSKLVISGRQHPCIMAMSYGVKYIPIEISMKVKNFHKENTSICELSSLLHERVSHISNLIKTF